ncbi:MAG: FkbM family methyltransferase, partial [Parachlamydiaceae bacterium]|nr:FkbM family methyltransferase [Parachlamydiaceae bacterium]
MKMRLANWFNALNFIAYLFGTAVYGDYQSQTSQDRLLNEIFFHDKRNGVFVDIGAYDGKVISNTYFYEKNLGWTGICIEPLPDAYEKLHMNRSCVTVNCAVGAKNEMISFLEIKSKNFPELASSDMRYQTSETLKNIEAVLDKYEGEYT